MVVTASVAGNAAKVFEAMGAGALDAINTPILGLHGDGAGHAALLHKIDVVARLIEAPKRMAHMPPVAPPNPCAAPGGCPPLIALGASTGGPAALQTILAPLPADLPAAVVIVQHVDEQFARSFAEWLNEQTALDVRLAQPGDRPRPGRVLVAGREEHLIMTAGATLEYTPEPADYPYRPSVNVFFESLARHWRGQAVGVLLTGMGRDGAQGLRAIRDAGGSAIVQDQATSTIYGMPQIALQVAGADRVAPLAGVGPAIMELLATRRPGLRP